jgi:predicted dienelactone hydrolase
MISFALLGGTPTSLRAFFDIYPIESSDDLREWRPYLTVVRTNALSNVVSLVIPRASAPASQHPNLVFLRTPTNHFITPVPQPSGPYAVGVVHRLLSDPTRTNRYGIKTNSSFMATIWYPADPIGGTLPSPYIEPALAKRGAYYFSEPANVERFVAFAKTAAPPVGRWPVVLYSHGYSAHRRQNTGKTEELASHGYVVMAVDHEDCFGTIFPDGRFLNGRYSDPVSMDELRRVTAGRVMDHQNKLNFI